MPIRKVLPLFAGFTLLLGTVVLGIPQAASAQPLSDLTCVAAANATVEPGVTLLPSPQNISVVLTLGSYLSPTTPCTSLTGNPPYTGAIFDMVGSGNLGCLLGSAGGTATITWNNGDTSTATWSLNLPIFLLPIMSITITGGPLTGATPFGLGVPTGFSGNCITSPLTNLGGLGIGLLVGL